MMRWMKGAGGLWYSVKGMNNRVSGIRQAIIIHGTSINKDEN